MKNRFSNKSKNGQLQISFGWLFAIIVGAIILFIAFYAAFRLINTGNQAQSASSGKNFEVLANTLQTGFSTSSTASFEMPLSTRIFNECDASGTFGSQKVSFSEFKLGSWGGRGFSTDLKNQYIFSNTYVQGQTFYLFTKNFAMPFSVSDVVYMTAANETYCFVNAPYDIQNDLKSLGQKNLFTSNCPAGSLSVCFDNGDSGAPCDIKVNTNLNMVQKDGSTMYYETNALMFGAIFSSKKVYECEVSRLMKRLSGLSLLYQEKESVISKQECLPEVNPEDISNAISGYNDSGNLESVKNAANEVDGRNGRAGACNLW